MDKHLLFTCCVLSVFSVAFHAAFHCTHDVVLTRDAVLRLPALIYDGMSDARSRTCLPNTNI